MKHFKAKNLIFIDESGANLKMSTAYARVEGGQRIKMPVLSKLSTNDGFATLNV